MSSTQYLADVYTRHQIDIEHYSTGETKKIEKYIKQAIKAAYDAASAAGTDWQTARYNQRIIALTAALDEIYGRLTNQLQLSLDDLVEYESEFNIKSLQNALVANVELAVPNMQLLKDAALKTPLHLESKTHSITDALTKYTNAQKQQIITSIRDAAVNGDTLSQMRTRLNSVGVQSRRQADTLARTINNHVVTQARDATLRANQDVLDGWRVVATLDSRTTLICASKDNTVYGWDDPKPPFHFNCRSTVSPVVKQEYSKAIKGTRAARGQDGKTTQVNSNLSYETWLKRQPADYQRDVLGPERYELFSKNKVSLKKFVDGNDRQLTIDEIRAREGLVLDS